MIHALMLTMRTPAITPGFFYKLTYVDQCSTYPTNSPDYWQEIAEHNLPKLLVGDNIIPPFNSRDHKGPVSQVTKELAAILGKIKGGR